VKYTACTSLAGTNLAGHNRSTKQINQSGQTKSLVTLGQRMRNTSAAERRRRPPGNQGQTRHDRRSWTTATIHVILPLPWLIAQSTSSLLNNFRWIGIPDESQCHRLISFHRISCTPYIESTIVRKIFSSANESLLCLLWNLLLPIRDPLASVPRWS
jgi:hypothetical protein